MILVTGANGHIGRRLIAALRTAGPVRALVRSTQAAGQLADLQADGAEVEVRIVDYLDPDAMTRAAQGCSHAVHLVGIIRETAATSFETAHPATTRVLAAAAAEAGVTRILYLSILGADPASANTCLASKAAAERALADGAVPSLVLRVPMVLGEGDHASRALYARARRRVDVQFRAASLEQPIYAGDVVAALLRGVAPAASYPPALTLDLAGPESLPRSTLTRRAAAVMGVRAPVVVSVPVAAGMLLAALLERVMENPPVTRAMLGVLDHDDRIDPSPALEALALTLTPLDVSLQRCLVAQPPW